MKDDVFKVHIGKGRSGTGGNCVMAGNTEGTKRKEYEKYF